MCQWLEIFTKPYIGQNFILTTFNVQPMNGTLKFAVFFVKTLRGSVDAFDEARLSRGTGAVR